MIYVNKLTFKGLSKREKLYLYAGDVPQNDLYNRYVGLSLSQSNQQHLKHDLTQEYPLENNCVDIYQSEDVFEHIELKKLPAIINEIYRVLKPNGIFRLSLPDYRCGLLYNRTLKGKYGEFLFDPVGGGAFVDGKVVSGGHVWFPTYEVVKDLLSKTFFKNITFYHYYDEFGNGVMKHIDYSIGYVMRTPDNDERVQNPRRPLSIVVDCIKEYPHSN